MAGCGTSQAAKYAMRWPRAKITAIDVSAISIACTNELKHRYSLDNLQVRELPVEHAAELGCRFEHIVCTGVLHHLPDPDAGLHALHDVLEPTGALHMMVYAPYGRAGVYLMQDYCRRLGIGSSASDVRDLAVSLRALPADHPLMPLLRNSSDFQTNAGLADALLNPLDRSFSVPELFEFLDRASLKFGRWIRQAPYLPNCGGVVSAPHRTRLMQLSIEEKFAAMELLRGTMVRHSMVAYSKGSKAQHTPIDFNGDAWTRYVPLQVSGTTAVRERSPKGATAVLINKNHAFRDIYLPINQEQEELLRLVDGRRNIGAIMGPQRNSDQARTFFELLWLHDQIVFDVSQR